MIGELKKEEKLALATSALKSVRTQLYALELEGVANRHSYRDNEAAKQRHDEHVTSLTLAIQELEAEYNELVRDKQ